MPLPEKSAQQGQSTKKAGTNTCFVCEKSFGNKRDLMLHQYIHKEKHSHFCAYCSKTFPNEVSFKRHQRLHARKKKSVTCRICAEEFDYSKELEDHHRENHLNEKLFRCEKCGVEFSWGEYLVKHMRMHDTETHSCTECGRGFMDGTSLRVHLRNHHQKKEEVLEKPYKCAVCGKCFKFDFSYEAHLNSHEFRSVKAAYGNDGTAKQSVLNKVMVGKVAVSSASTPYQYQVKTHATASASTSSAQGSQPEEIILEIVSVPELPADGVANGAEVIAQVAELKNEPGKLSPADQGGPGPSLEGFTEQPDSNQGGASSCVAEQAGPTNGGSSEQVNTKEEPDVKPQVHEADPKQDVVKPVDHCIKAGPKAPKRKRIPTPLKYDYVMREDKPFACQYCNMCFRWDISLQIHIKTHEEGYVEPRRRGRTSVAGHSYTPQAKANANGKSDQGNGKSETSKIVAQRACSDEEEDYEAEDDDYVYVDGALMKTPSPAKQEQGKNPQIIVLSPGSLQQLQKQLADSDVQIQSVQPAKRRKLNLQNAQPVGSHPQHGGPLATSGPIKQEASGPTVQVAANQMAQENVEVVASSDEEHPVLIRCFLQWQKRKNTLRSRYICRHCYHVCTTRLSAQSHRRRHMGSRWLTCSVCQRQLPSQLSMVLHRLSHTVHMDNRCELCGKVYEDVQALQRHQIRHISRITSSTML